MYRAIGKRVRTLREERGWSQARLAERAGIGVAYVTRIEGAKKRATVETLEALARAFEVPLWRLLASTRLSVAERATGAVLVQLLRAAETLGDEDVARLVDLAKRLGRR